MHGVIDDESGQLCVIILYTLVFCCCLSHVVHPDLLSLLSPTIAQRSYSTPAYHLPQSKTTTQEKALDDTLNGGADTREMDKGDDKHEESSSGIRSKKKK
jgi:hypothetical protein